MLTVILAKEKLVRGKLGEMYSYEQTPITTTAKTLREASKLIRGYIDNNSLTSSTFSGGQVVYNDKEIARISYNGRIWEPGKYPTPEFNDSDIDVIYE
jgi:hypothetical protein